MSLEGVTLIHLWRCSWCINCLHSTVALLVVHFRTTFKWVSLRHKCAFSSFVVLFQQMNNWKVFLRGLCCVKMQEESLPFMKKNMVLQEWLGVWTACTCSGRIALWPGKALKWERQVSQPLFWRRMLLITTCSFGITPLDGQDCWGMTSTSGIGVVCWKPILTIPLHQMLILSSPRWQQSIPTPAAGCWWDLSQASKVWQNNQRAL